MGLGQNAIDIVINARDKFSGTFKKAGLSMKSFQKSALAMGAIGGVIAYGLKGAVDASIELETAMVGVRKTTGLSAEAITGLRNEFIEMSKIMPLTVTELANIGEVAGQLGIQGVDNIKSFTEVAAKMSIATELSAENAALAMAKISNAMGLPIEEAEKLGSAINELSNISAASSTEIISALTRVAGSAKTLGLSTDVVTGLVASLIAAGEPAERAGTKLRSAFDAVVKNMDDVVDFMPDFKEAFAVDADQAILTLINRISEIKDPLAKQEKAMKLFGTVGASAINKLSNNLPEMNRLIKESGKQFNNATSLQDEYDIALESTANQVQLAKNAFTAMQLEIADVLMPALAPLIQAVRVVFNWFSQLPGPVKEAIVIFAAVSAVLLLVAAAIALVTLVSSPWLLIIFAIAAAITAIILIFKNWRTIMASAAKFGMKVGMEMMLFFQRFADVWKIIWAGVSNAFIFVWNKIVSFYENSINFVIKGINRMIGVINKIPRISIPLIPEVDFSGIKGEMTDLGALSMELETNRLARRAEAERNLANVNVHIDNVYGTDPDDMADAFGDKMDNVIRLN